jgi:hypothetical protein
LDEDLVGVGLTGTGLALKQGGFDVAVEEYMASTSWLQRRKWFGGVLRWLDVVLGSLGSVPALSVVLDPIKEWKESVEAQVETETGPRGKGPGKSRKRRR